MEKITKCDECGQRVRIKNESKSTFTQYEPDVYEYEPVVGD